MHSSIAICRVVGATLLLVLTGMPAFAEAPSVSGGGCDVTFDKASGEIASVHLRGTSPTSDADLHGGLLWQIRLKSGAVLTSRSSADALHPVRAERLGPQEWRLTWSVGSGTVSVRATGHPAGVDLRATVQGLPEAALQVALPADLTFRPASTSRLLFPDHLGIALKGSFFARQQGGTAQESVVVGPDALRRIAGLGGLGKPGQDAPVAVRATDTARRLLGPAICAEWKAAPHTVNRAAASPDDLLVDSQNGALLAGYRVGRGTLYRVGGPVGPTEAGPLVKSVEALIAALSRSAAPDGARRKTVIMPVLNGGPEQGQWTSLAIETWRARLAASPLFASAGLHVLFPKDYKSLRAALADPAALAVINPYGEAFPSEGDWKAAADAVRTFMVGGGIWVETGGYSFYASLPPAAYLRMEENYPSRGFSDFARLESGPAAVNIYGVQPAADPGRIFVPAHWAAFGAPDGGHLQRTWLTFVAKGAAWETPAVRLSGTDTAPAALRAYVVQNGLTKGLAGKMSAKVRDLWRRSVLVKLEGADAAAELAVIPKLPAPSLLHLVGYLHGGFDRQYPDHLPPNPVYGTPRQLAEVIALAHRTGDLVMPYTNHTWWPDNPKGPTFEAAGEAPLLLDAEGVPHHETYGGDTSGWTVSPYHPTVKASADRIANQFTKEYPVDILFHDQNGARGLEYDFNPASPTPYAYTQGLIDLAARTAARIPAATEDGFDRLINSDAQFCGLSQQQIAREGTDAPLSRKYGDEVWEFYPMAQFVAHDKAFFSSHDLEPGVNRRESLLWSLALGYQMSLAISPRAYQGRVEQTLEYLAALQRVLGPHYMGMPLRKFAYLKGSGGSGVMRAIYGKLAITVNLTDQPFAAEGVRIAPRGFYARGVGVEAGIVLTGGSGAKRTETYLLRDAAHGAANLCAPPGWD